MGTFSELIKYLKIYRGYLGRRMYIIFVLSSATAFTSGFGIALLLPLLRTVTGSGGGTEDMGTVEQALYDLLAWMGIAESLVGILAFIAVVFLGKGLLQFAQGGYRGYLQAQLLKELKGKLFDAYGGMEYRHYIEQNTGHFINVINQQVNRFFGSFDNFVGFLTQILTTLSYFVFALAITWKFTLLAFGIGVVMLFLFQYLNTYVRTLSRKQSREMSNLNELLVQALQAFKYVVSTNQATHLRSRVMESIDRLTDYLFRQKLASAFTGAVKEPTSVLLIVAIIALQVTVFQEPITPIFVALLLFHRAMQSVITVQGSWQRTMNAIGAVEMVDEEFSRVLAHQEDREGREAESLAMRIEFRDVCFAYDETDGDVLKQINLEVLADTTVALVGESGAGKSTLVDMMTFMLRPRTGEILVDGVPREEIDFASWRSQIGYVSQETVVFDDTIANNITLWRGNIEEDPVLRERVHDAARRANAEEFIRALPEGYETTVGDQGVRLSGGQRQRLFIARELFKQPDLLLLDEATSDLDTASEQHIQQSIDALQGEVTVVIIAHRLSTVKNADRVYVLDQGRIVEEGTYSNLRFKENGQFREMVEVQNL